MSGLTLAVECVVFAAFVALTTCAPLWRRRGGGGGAGAGVGDAKLAYVFAGGVGGGAASVSTLAMILSVARGTLGVRTFLGYPSELMYHGAGMWETLYGMLLAFPLVAWLLLPLYLRLHTTSVYEYLELRFGGKAVRRLASGTFVLRQLLNLAVTVYTPCVAVRAALGVPQWASAAATAAIAAVFTVLGGLSAAIRADVIQTVTMVVVSLGFMVHAGWRAGGPAAVLRANIDGGRLQFFNFTWDPSVRVDTVSATLGQLFMSLSIYGCQQTFVQRYVSLGSVARARRTLLLAAPAVALLFSLSWLVGMALYALYVTCDPLAAGATAAPDELLPYYVRAALGGAPGVMGLFLAALFNGALSFLVSNVNSLATVTWEDFVSCAPAFRGAPPAQQLSVIKAIGVLYTILIALLSLGVGSVGGVVEGSLLVTSATSGALLGVFLLAALCPVATAASAAAGVAAAHIVTVALAAARYTLLPRRAALLPTSTAGCGNMTLAPSLAPAPLAAAALNHTLRQLAPLLALQEAPLHAPTAPSAPSAPGGWLVHVYSVSYMWYAVIGTVVCVGVGAAWGALRYDARPVDPRLLLPGVARLARALPALRRRLLPAPLDTKPAPPTPAQAPPPSPSPRPPPPRPAATAPALVACSSSRLFDAYSSPAPSPPPPRSPRSPSPRVQRTRF